jgi:hypothetical protein
MKSLKTLMAGTLLAVMPAMAHADILYSQAFTGGTADPLNGTTVEAGTLSGDWIAGDVFQLDGTTVDAGRRTSALLPFAITEGEIYELTVTASIDGASNQFLGLGFADNIAFTGGAQNDANQFRLAGTVAQGVVAGYAWMFSAPETGQAVSAFDGDGINNGVVSGSLISTDTPTMKIILDASDSVNWTTEYYYNGSLIGSSSQAKAFYANVDSVGLTVGNATGSFSDFKLEVVPEPGSLALLGLGGLMVLRRRRDK